MYPSWIEIPVADIERAISFYRAVFELDDPERYDDEPDTRIAVLRASDKSVQAPGVSLVASPLHQPGQVGVIVNFHLGAHAALDHAIAIAIARGGTLVQAPTDQGEGQRYAVLQDSEGNPFSLSSYEG
jgi:predicted enzyme related to lactoylglutathione lyase